MEERQPSKNKPGNIVSPEKTYLPVPGWDTKIMIPSRDRKERKMEE